MPASSRVAGAPATRRLVLALRTALRFAPALGVPSGTSLRSVRCALPFGALALAGCEVTADSPREARPVEEPAGGAGEAALTVEPAPGAALPLWLPTRNV